jgi:hypothetical protein
VNDFGLGNGLAKFRHDKVCQAVPHHVEIKPKLTCCSISPERTRTLIAMMISEGSREERKRIVCLIRDWLKSDSGTSDQEIHHKLQASGTRLSLEKTRQYCQTARILLNREAVFGADAERMFPKPTKRR